MSGVFRRRGVSIPRTKSEAEAAEVARTFLMTGCRKVQMDMREADDDWDPVWLVLTQRQGTMLVGNLAPRDMVRRVADFARRVGATAIGHLHSSWVVLAEEVGAERFAAVHRQMLAQDGSTEGIAERREVLLVQVVTATLYEGWHAPIIRRASEPPLLSAFEQMTPGGGFATGAMVDPLREALVKLG